MQYLQDGRTTSDSQTHNTTDIYNNSLVRTNPFSLLYTQATLSHNSEAKIGNYVLFGGGFYYSDSSATSRIQVLSI